MALMSVSESIEKLYEQIEQCHSESKACDEGIGEIWLEMRNLDKRLKKMRQEIEQMARLKLKKEPEPEPKSEPPEPEQEQENNASETEEDRPEVIVTMPTSKEFLIKLVQAFSAKNITITSHSLGLGISSAKE